MKCVSCNAEIPPEWVNAIQSNVCPGCGGAIMREEDKEFLDGLAQAIKDMPNDPQGVAGWLMSNYRIEKIGEAKPVEKFHRKTEVDEVNIKIAPNPMNKFLANTDQFNQVQATQAKVAQLRGGGPPVGPGTGGAPGGGGDRMAAMAALVTHAETSDPYGTGGGQQMEDYQNAPAQNEDVATYNAMRQAGLNPFQGSGDGGMINPNAAPLNAEELSAVANMTKLQDDMLPQERAAASTEEGRRELMLQRYKRVQAQEAIDGGGSGSFRRSGG